MVKGNELTNLKRHDVTFPSLFIFSQTECNLSKDSSTSTDDSIESFQCASKCLNELNNIELCRCHQNNEIGKRKQSLSNNQTQFAIDIAINENKIFLILMNMQKFDNKVFKL
jgi:hypothetical protein